MKNSKSIFLLFVSISFCYGQEKQIDLEIQTELEKNQPFIDSLHQQSRFQDYKSVLEYTESLVQYLKEKGYLYVRDSLADSNQFNPVLHLRLNEKITQLEIAIPQEMQEFLGRFKNNLENDLLQIDFEEFIALQGVITKGLAKAGRPFNTFQLVDIEEKEGKTLKATMAYREKKTRTIDKIYVKGYEKFPRPFIRHRLGMRTQQIFNPDKILRKNKNLANLAFASSIKDPEIQFTQDSTKVYLYIEKSNANVFDGFIGFNSTEESSLELNGYIDLNLINNLHLGEELRINYKNDGREQQQFNARAVLPYLFETPISFGAGLNIFRKDSTFSNTTQDLKLTYQLTPLIDLGGTAEFTSSSILLDQNVNTSEVGANFNAAFYGLTASFFKLEPIVGKFFNQKQIEVSFLTGERQSAISSSQLKATLFSQYSFKLYPSLYLYSSANAAWLSSSDYIDNELFRFGGINSIRGFEENGLVASLYGTLATELRYFLGPNLYANSVLDYGYFENSLTQISQSLYSFGFGLGLETQAGVLRLIFANGTSKTQDFSFENTQVHLSLNTFF